MTIGQDQKNAGPPRPIPRPKLPNEPVETLMKLNAIAKFERNPRVRLSSGLMPSDRSCASSRAAISADDDMGPDTDFLLYRHGSSRPTRETVLFEGTGNAGLRGDLGASLSADRQRRA